jgi:RNA polymerase sigma-70 factor (sigma-E family)
MTDFEDFVAAREYALLRFAYLLAGDRHLAEDLTQEALVRVHRRWRAIERKDRPEAYVRKTIVRQFLSWRRRRSSGELAVDGVPDQPMITDEYAHADERDEMWAALATLPPQQRTVMVLRYYEDLADADIAEVLGCSAATVRVHAFKALHRLRDTIGPRIGQVGTPHA